MLRQISRVGARRVPGAVRVERQVALGTSSWATHAPVRSFSTDGEGSKETYQFGFFKLAPRGEVGKDASNMKFADGVIPSPGHDVSRGDVEPDTFFEMGKGVKDPKPDYHPESNLSPAQAMDMLDTVATRVQKRGGTALGELNKIPNSKHVLHTKWVEGAQIVDQFTNEVAADVAFYQNLAKADRSVAAWRFRRDCALVLKENGTCTGLLSQPYVNMVAGAFGITPQYNLGPGPVKAFAFEMIKASQLPSWQGSLLKKYGTREKNEALYLDLQVDLVNCHFDALGQHGLNTMEGWLATMISWQALMAIDPEYTDMLAVAEEHVRKMLRGEPTSIADIIGAGPVWQKGILS